VIEIPESISLILAAGLTGGGEVMEAKIDIEEPVEINEEIKGKEGTVGNEIIVEEIGEMEWDGEGIVQQSNEAKDIPTDTKSGVRITKSIEDGIRLLLCVQDDHFR
jgi:hypothetical protein